MLILLAKNIPGKIVTALDELQINLEKIYFQYMFRNSIYCIYKRIWQLDGKPCYLTSQGIYFHALEPNTTQIA